MAPLSFALGWLFALPDGEPCAPSPALPDPPADGDIDDRDSDQEPREGPAKGRQALGAVVDPRVGGVEGLAARQARRGDRAD